ncbi:MAG TPA: OmpA family protein [Nevskiales bacterium]|nr:OmpA family protein [Nevskiales bacterium]
MRGVLACLPALLLGGCVLWGADQREEAPQASSAPAAARPPPERTALLQRRREIPPNPELERSRALIEQAARDPTVSQHFQDDLARARAALDQAVMIWNEEKGRLDTDDEEWLQMRHLNYMARQRTALAVMKARGLDARRELEALQSTAPPRRPEAAVAESEATPPAVPLALRALQPRRETRGLVLTLGEQHFEPGQARLINSDTLLDAVLQYLVAHPATSLACEGYSDGAAAQKLSQQRARAVQQALLERGLELSRVTAVGYGSAGGAGARVELVISDTPPPDFDGD